VSNWYTELRQKLNEGYAGGDDVAHIESYLDYIDELVMKLDDKKAAYEIQNAADDIRKALDLDPTNIRAKFDESKSQGDAWYKEQRAKEAYEKANPGKRWKDLPYGYKEDWRKKTESVESGEMIEAVGDSAEAFYQLQDEFCGGECPSHAHRALIDELIRSMTGDEVKRFVDDFRRHYDMNDMEENVEEADYDPELSVMANSSDNVERTYAEIIKGDAEQTEVGDYIGRGMTKDQILKLIDMLEPQGYDKDFLLKDLAPMMEAGCNSKKMKKEEQELDEEPNEGNYKRRRLSKEERQEFRLREKKLHETSRVRSLKDELVKELGD
jgi:hypothetical protein